MQGATKDDDAVESFGWSLALDVKFLVRAATEGSTIAMMAIMSNSRPGEAHIWPCGQRSARRWTCCRSLQRASSLPVAILAQASDSCARPLVLAVPPIVMATAASLAASAATVEAGLGRDNSVPAACMLTQLRRRQRKAYIDALLAKLDMCMASEATELGRRLSLTAPVLAADIAGADVLRVHRMRRNAAQHTFGVPASVIARAGRSELNAIQRSSRAPDGERGEQGLSASEH